MESVVNKIKAITSEMLDKWDPKNRRYYVTWRRPDAELDQDNIARQIGNKLLALKFVPGFASHIFYDEPAYRFIREGSETPSVKATLNQPIIWYRRTEKNQGLYVILSPDDKDGFSVKHVTLMQRVPNVDAGSFRRHMPDNVLQVLDEITPSKLIRPKLTLGTNPRHERAVHRLMSMTY